MTRNPGPPDNPTAVPETQMSLSGAETTPDDEGTTLDDDACSDNEDKTGILDGNAVPEKVAVCQALHLPRG